MSEILDKFKKLCCDYGYKCPSVFAIEFRRMKELEDEIESALKLQELVKERITFLKNTTINLRDEKYLHGKNAIQGTLQSLVEKSEK